jgi:hypothetical protein
MKPHVTAAFGDPNLIAEVIAEHLNDHHRVNPTYDRPFVVSSTPILNEGMRALQVIQVTVMVLYEEDD